MAHVLAVTNTESPDALPVPYQKNLHMPLLSLWRRISFLAVPENSSSTSPARVSGEISAARAGMRKTPTEDQSMTAQITLLFDAYIDSVV
jgi:hypothetical protein